MTSLKENTIKKAIFQYVIQDTALLSWYQTEIDGAISSLVPYVAELGVPFNDDDIKYPAIRYKIAKSRPWQLDTIQYREVTFDFIIEARTFDTDITDGITDVIRERMNVSLGRGIGAFTETSAYMTSVLVTPPNDFSLSIRSWDIVEVMNTMLTQSENTSIQSTGRMTDNSLDSRQTQTTTKIIRFLANISSY